MKVKKMMKQYFGLLGAIGINVGAIALILEGLDIEVLACLIFSNIAFSTYLLFTIDEIEKRLDTTGERDNGEK